LTFDKKTLPLKRGLLTVDRWLISHFIFTHFKPFDIMRNFRKYDIWTDGIDFSIGIYKTTSSFPSDERFGLISQMRRAAVSIPSNIAEGASRKSNLEFSRFIEISLGSSFELETQLIISLQQKYISSEAMNALLPPLQSLQRRLNALRNTLLD